jgi:hypothetical protein
MQRHSLGWVAEFQLLELCTAVIKGQWGGGKISGFHNFITKVFEHFITLPRNFCLGLEKKIKDNN